MEGTPSNAPQPCGGRRSTAFVRHRRRRPGLHAERAFTIRATPDGLSTVVISHETQVGLLPWLGRLFLAPRLHAANQAMFDDLARAAGQRRGDAGDTRRHDQRWTFTKITTAGAGTMGSQVAWQMAFHGKHVTVYDAIPAGLEKGKAFHREYAEHFIKQRGATRKQIDDTFARLTYTTDLAAAVRDADLISESVPESMPIKESFWREASRHAPARTVFTTNTSTLPPSALAGFVDRPQKFLALHFAIGVWDSNIGEVMGHPGTDPAVFERVLKFAEEIGLVPIPIRKEQNGYIINSLIVPWCTAALDLLVRGVSDFQSIDRTWMITLQSGMGPCGMMDRMGLGVVYHVAKLIGETTPNTQALEYARYVDEHFIQKGRLGVASGQGFYSYPNPAFAQPGFI